jgi:peptidoglycan/xylan/chitin deacetylase (PgdA/CDA1 family)
MMAAFKAVPFRQDPLWNDYWQLIDAGELKELSLADGITIGGHGTLHHNLDVLPMEDALADVKMGLEWIKTAISKPVKAFAFPDGAYTPELVNAIADLGVTQLLLVNDRFQDQADPRLRERFTVHPFLPTQVLMAEILKGHYF